MHPPLSSGIPPFAHTHCHLAQGCLTSAASFRMRRTPCSRLSTARCQQFGRQRLRRVRPKATTCKAEPVTQTFSTEGFDSALERGEIEVCWQQILNLKERIRGQVPRVDGAQEGTIRIGDDPGIRAIDQLIYDSAGPGSFSLLENAQKNIVDVDQSDGEQLPQDSEDEDLILGASTSEEPGQLESELSVNEDAAALVDQQTWQKQMLKEILLDRHKKFVKQCIATSRKDLLVEYLRLLPAQERVFSWLLRECLQAKDCDCVLPVLEVREELGLKQDKYSFSALITALVRQKDMDGARNAFQDAMEKGIRSLYLYNAMIDGYGRSGDIIGATEIWDACVQDGLEPDAFTYTGLIRAMGNAQKMDKMKNLLHEMIDCNLQPMPHTFTIMFDAATACGKKDAEWLLSLCDVMSEFDIQMNNHILSAMITSLAQVHLTAEQVDFVFDQVDDFRSSVGSTAAMVYSTLLLFCGRQGIPERVVDVWNAMQEDGVKPNCHIYSAALTTCSLDLKRDSLVADFALEIGDKLQKEWHLNKSYEQRSVLIAFNSLVNAYASLFGMDKAMAIYRSMKKYGPRPDLITCNTLLAGFSSRGDLRAALQIKEDIRRSCIRPSGQTYVALLTCCSKARQPDLAWDLFQEMTDAGIATSVEAYTALMDAFVKDGSDDKLNLAFTLFDELKTDGLKPTAVTYGCLLMGCLYSNDVERAFSLYREAHESNIQPTDTCHNILINMCTLAGRLDEALEVVKNLARLHGSIEHDTLNSLVRSLARSNISRAIVVLRLMRSRDMEPSRETYHELIVSCSVNAWSGMALDLYKQMRKQGIKGSRRVGSALIVVECNANKMSSALLIAVDMMRSAGLPDLVKHLTMDLITKHSSVSVKSGLQDRSQLPDASALGMLCCCLVQENRLVRAMQVFRLIKLLEGDQGVMSLVSKFPYIFECLIECSCSQKRVDDALEVFDIWKASAAMLLSKNRLRKGEEWAYNRYPHISQASLAFLKATCQTVPRVDWRVLDVCASMRQQREWAHEATLPRPQPSNHHFLEPN